MIISVDVETSKDGFKLDLEAHPNAFILGCVYDGSEYKLFTSPTKMWNYIVELGTHLHRSRKMLYVYAHKHIYDILTYAPRHNNNLVFLNDDPLIASYRVEDKDVIRFYDSKAIFPGSLDKLGKIMNIPKLTIPKRVNIFELGPYCKRDCRIVYDSIVYLKEKLKEKGVDIRYYVTINQIAINMVLKEFKNFKAHYFWYNRDKNMPKFIREKTFVHNGYRGGRIQAFQTGYHKDCVQIDCNSLYGLGCMLTKFPDLRTQRSVFNPLASMDLIELLSKPGISKCLVINESDNYGLLPVRTPAFSYVPTYNTLMIGTWTHCELLKSIQNGYRIIEIEKSVFWEESKENPYLTIIPKWYKERLTSPFWSAFYKNIITRHLGKFGQKLKEREMIIDDVSAVYDYVDRGFKPKKGYKDDYLYEKEIKSTFKKYYIPIIPALVSAESRIYMYDCYKKIPKDKLLYTATDSIMVKAGTDLSDFRFSDKIGDFKVEASGNSMIWGRNTYSIDKKYKAGGISLKSNEFDNFKKGVFKSKSMNTYKNSPTIDKVGTFYEKTHDLYETMDAHTLNMEKLSSSSYLQDFYLSDVSYFQDSLLKEIEALKKPL